MTNDDQERETERLIPIREETGLPPPPESGVREVLERARDAEPVLRPSRR